MTEQQFSHVVVKIPGQLDYTCGIVWHPSENESDWDSIIRCLEDALKSARKYGSHFDDRPWVPDPVMPI